MTRRLRSFNSTLRARTMPLLMVVTMLFGCAAPALREADQLALDGQHEQALTVLDAARQRDPADSALRTAQRRQRELTMATLANQADAARVNGQWGQARDVLARLEALDANHPRTQGLRLELARATRHAPSAVVAGGHARRRGRPQRRRHQQTARGADRGTGPAGRACLAAAHR